jgi:hypothetical protein
MATIDPGQSADKLISMTAEVEGGYKARTVRANGGKVPIATSTYNYNQDEDTKNEVARRIAALWNLACGMPTSELEALVKSGARLRKQ